MTRFLVLPTLLAFIVLINVRGTFGDETYSDFLPIWDSIEVGGAPVGSPDPAAAPDGSDVYQERVEEPPCMQTDTACNDEQCTINCQKLYGQDGGCMVVPDNNICCCGI
ncbi:unnamed protein product [Amaranthus hypochondriacus]